MFSRRRSAVLVAAAAALLLFSLAGVGCSRQAAPPTRTAAVTAPQAVPDTALSYRNVSLTAPAATPAVSAPAAAPGESETLPRSFENAPPLIPHAIDGLVPITREENACLGCHNPDDAPDVGATPVPASHLYDIRRDRPLDHVNPAQYNCTQCHVPQHDAPSLVDNDFRPEFRDARLRRMSDLLDTLHEGVR